MTKYFVLFLVSMCSLSALAQYNFKEHYFDRNNATHGKENYLEISGQYLINGNPFSNSFTREIYNSGAFSEDLKSDVISNLTKSNSIGFAGLGSVLYKRKLDKFNLRIGLSTQIISNNKLSNDLVKLVLNGNAPYAEENMDLSNTKIQVDAFHKLSIGGEKLINNKFLIGGAVNFYKAAFHYDLDISKADFYTKQDGTEVTLDTKFSQSYSGNDAQGGGVGLDLYFVSNFENGNLIIQVEDLGFIRYKKIQQYQVDSNYVFTGREIDDIFDINASNSNDNITDYFGIDSTSSSKTISTPTKITLGLQEKIGEKLFLEVYTNYQFVTAYIPQMIIKPNILLNKNFSVAPIINLGGFGKADLGLNVSYHHSNYFVTLDLLEFENLIAPKTSSGRASMLKAGLLF